MIKAIIVDDEIKSIISLKWELSNFSEEILIKETFTRPEEAIAYLQTHNIDCVFLDIEMQEIDGFQFLKAFPTRNFCVVFVTAYDSYAINAIKERAFDYLLKPVDIDDLNQTIGRIKAYLKSKSRSEHTEYSGNLSLKKQIKLYIDGHLRIFSPEEIVFCKSDGNYCHLHLKDGQHYLLSKKLKDVEKELIDTIFIRVHNSYNVNLTMVRSYDKTNQVLCLINGKKIPVSRSKKNLVLQKLTSGK